MRKEPADPSRSWRANRRQNGDIPYSDDVLVASACGRHGKATAGKGLGRAFEWMQIRPTGIEFKPLPPTSSLFLKEGGGGCACAATQRQVVLHARWPQLEIVRNKASFFRAACTPILCK